MLRLFDWCHCKHPRLAHYARVAYALAIVMCILGGGYALGSLVTWTHAGHVIAQQRADYRQSLDLLSGRVATGATANQEAASSVEQAAKAVEQAAEKMGGAAIQAGTAGRTARGAAVTAKAAAETAKSAAQDLSDAIAPPAPKEVPTADWLGGP